MSEHISLTHDFVCPRCGCKWFRSRGLDDPLARIYECKGCRWEGTDEEAFTVAKSTTDQLNVAEEPTPIQLADLRRWHREHPDNPDIAAALKAAEDRHSQAGSENRDA